MVVNTQGEGKKRDIAVWRNGFNGTRTVLRAWITEELQISSCIITSMCKNGGKEGVWNIP